jgi:hypothetical protein
MVQTNRVEKHDEITTDAKLAPSGWLRRAAG